MSRPRPSLTTTGSPCTNDRGQMMPSALLAPGPRARGGRASGPMMMICPIILMVLAMLTTVSASSCTFTSLDTYPKGKCVPYSGLCQDVVGSKLFVPDDPSYPDEDVMEAKARESILRVRQNEGVVPEVCVVTIDTIVCSSFMMGCQDDPSTGEGIPILPCQSACQRYWSPGVCLSTAELYYQYILVPQGQSAKDSEFTFCAPNGYYPEDPLPPDFFGGREIPTRLPYPVGLNGTLLYPAGEYQYKLSTGTTVNVMCKTLPVRTSRIVLPPACKYPTVAVGEKCLLLCPFQLGTTEEADASIAAYVVPGVVAAVLCLFVLVDSLWVIFETSGGDVWRILHLITGSFSTGGSRGGNKTATGSGDSRPPAPDSIAQTGLVSHGDPTTPTSAFSAKIHNGGGGHISDARRRHKRPQLRAATYFALGGALLGLTFFFLGPFITLLEGTSVSCRGPNTFTDMNAVVNASSPDRDPSTSACRAQRVTPFILQAIFNLIFYAMVRVHLVVRNVKFSSEQRRRVFNGSLLAYTAGVPLVCFLATTSIEGFDKTFEGALLQITRQTIICINRYSNAGVEFALIFLPYVLTGIGIVIVCASVLRELRDVRRKVAGIRDGRSRHAVALEHLLIRLVFLGISTFILLIILMSTTGSIMVVLSTYAHNFQLWFICQQTGTACTSCSGLLEAADATRPPNAVISLQLFCMSGIVCLFGGFFGAQSASRLYAEYNDGVLMKKIENVWYGRYVHEDTDSNVGMHSSGTGASPRPQQKRPKGGDSAQSSRGGESSAVVVAAYMSSGEEGETETGGGGNTRE